MVMRLFLVYVLVELTAVVALTSALGFGVTLLILIGVFLAGLLLAGSQARRQLVRLRSGLATPQAAASDAALIALGTVLTVIPGLVTSVLGLLLLFPPTRVLARPVVAAVFARRLARVPVVATRRGTRPGPARGAGFAGRPMTTEVIDGEVVDGEVIDSHLVTDRVAPADGREPGRGAGDALPGPAR